MRYSTLRLLLLLKLLIFLLYIYILVDCQIDFELKAEQKLVTGSFGGSVTLQWNILKQNDTDRLQTATSIIVKTSQDTLYNLAIATQKPADVKASILFPNRMVADIIDGKTYLLTLQNLNYNDSNSFQLIVGIGRGLLTSNLKRVLIQLIVKGMEHVIFSIFYSKR